MDDQLVSDVSQKALTRLQRLGMLPLDSPFMPPPGPDFLRVANGLSEESYYKVASTKKKGKTVKTVDYYFGEVLHELYLRALREPLFQMQIEAKRGVFKEAVFVPGHIWSENWDSYVESVAKPNVRAKPVTGPAPADVMVIGKMPWKEEMTVGRNFVSTTGKELIEAIKHARIKGSRDWYITNLVKFVPPDETTTLKASWIADCLPLLAQELRLVRPKFIVCLGADACKYLLKHTSHLGHVEGTSLKKHGIGYLEGRTITFRYFVGEDADKPEWQEARVIVTPHPAAVVHDDSVKRQLHRGFERFNLILNDKDTGEETDLDHRVCETLEEAEAILAEAEADLTESPLKFVAWDAEWQGQHPMNEGSYIRTIQMSWKFKNAICFKLRHAGGKISFVDADDEPAIDRLMVLLTKFMKGKRAVGHFLVADLEWLQYFGFDLLSSFKVPTEPDAEGNPAWYRCQMGEGGFDTAMACHALEETSFLGLETLTMRYTSAPRYDIPLEDWKNAYCKAKNIKPAALEGYGDCPDDVLIPYALYDADVSLRIAYRLEELLSCDYFEQNAWEAFWESMIIQPVILEIHQTGIAVDRFRVDKLTTDFLRARNNLEAEIKKEINWPNFNLRSPQQVREYLFGEELNRAVTKDSSKAFTRLRPKDAISLRIEPLVNTDKRPKRWAELVDKGVVDEHTPSTSKATLAILAQDNPDYEKDINRLRDHRFLDQVLKSVLRPPLQDKDGVYLVDDDNGCFQYDKGLAASIDDDGRVRPNLRPTAETGRWKCARPNLQNLAKARDPDYERLLGKEEDGTLRYKHKIRSMLCSPSVIVSEFRKTWKQLKRKAQRQRLLELYQPILKYPDRFLRDFMKDDSLFIPGEDEVFIDFDFKGAELYGMAVMSGDEIMIEHAKRNIVYPDEGYDANGKEVPGGKFAHPEYFDIHSNVAVMAFRLTIPDGTISDEKTAKKLGVPVGTSFSDYFNKPVGSPLPATKNGLAAIGKAHLRIVAKSVIFGVAYGRAAKAIALAVREQKVEISEDEAQQVINALFSQYTKLKPYFEACCKRAVEERWLCNCYGRFRHFPEVDDRKAAGEFERQAMNFPIQSAIASALDRGVMELYNVRTRMEKEYGEKPFLFCLTIHDAVLIQAKARYVSTLIDSGIIETAMCKTHPIFPADLSGMPMPGGPYYLGLDFEVSEYWSETVSTKRCEELGIPTKFGK